MGFFKQAFKGISWMAMLRFVTRALALLKTAILARIFLPAQFGIYGIATLVLGFLEMMTETGINIFLIQEREKIDKYIDSSWVVSILRGILISSAIFLTIPLITSFFAVPGARNILILTAFVPLIRGFINPACVYYQKNLQFDRQFYYDSAIFLTDTAFAIGIGIITKSENAFIWGMIASAVFEVAASFVMFKPTPRFRFEKEKTLKVISRGKWITGAGIFNYLFQNIDDIAVGKAIGTVSLGVYQQAYKISSLPVSEVGEVFNRVTFPIYAALSGDKKRIKKAFLKTLAAISVLVIPFGAVVFYFPETVIRIVLGENWIGAVPVLQLLAIFGVLKAISNSFFSLFLGLGRQEVVTIITFVSALVLGASIMPLIGIFGVLGAAYAAIIATLVSLPLTVFYFFRELR